MRIELIWSTECLSTKKLIKEGTKLDVVKLGPNAYHCEGGLQIPINRATILSGAKS